MKFGFPYLLLLLIVLALLWRMRASRPVSETEKRRLPLLVLSIACLILAMARPYWSTTTEKRMIKGADFIILLDVSQSMFCPTERGVRRIDEARNFLRQLLPQFSGSSMAVIYFAGDAQIGCPLTDDMAAVGLFLDSIAPGMTGKPGTDQIESEVGTSSKRRCGKNSGWNAERVTKPAGHGSATPAQGRSGRAACAGSRPSESVADLLG